MAEPRDALQVRVDDEERDRDRPEPAHDRVELEDGDEEDGERRRAEHEHLPARERPGGELAARRARIARVDLRVDQPVQTHRERARTDHRHRHPEPVRRRGRLAEREQHPDVREGKREDRVLELHERREAARERDGRRRHVCLCAVSASASRPSACAERRLQHGIPVPAAARRAREVDDEGAPMRRRRPRARAARAASSRASRRGSPPRSPAPRARSPSAWPRV